MQVHNIRLFYTVITAQSFNVLLLLVILSSHSIADTHDDLVKNNIDKLIRERECRGCNLQGAILNGTNLKRVNLGGANLNFARFHLATLRGANLQNASLLGASFKGADISEADFRGADSDGASFAGAYSVDTLFGELTATDVLQDTSLQTAENGQGVISSIPVAEPLDAPQQKKVKFFKPIVTE